MGLLNDEELKDFPVVIGTPPQVIAQAQHQLDLKEFIELLELINNMYGVDRLILSFKQLVEKK